MMASVPNDFPLLPMTSSLTLQKCKSLADDLMLPTIFIASYPKSGTTWLQAIVFQILTTGGKDFEHISFYSPFYEMDSTWSPGVDSIVNENYTENHRRIGHRVFNTHLLFEMLPQGKSMYFLYIIRSGKDVVVSFFHHLTHQEEGGYSGTFDDFFEDWCSGNIAFGKWTNHLRSWLRALLPRSASSDRILLLRYDDLLSNLPSEIERISNFLGMPVEPSCAEMLSKRLEFTAMKQEIHKYQPISVTWTGGYCFLRQGITGDHRTLFDSVKLSRFQRFVEETLLRGDEDDQEIFERCRVLKLFE